MMCISETYLDPRFSDCNLTLNLAGYNLVGGDNSNNTKIGNICVYFKESFIFLSAISPYLKKKIFSRNLFSKTAYKISLYRSPSQINNNVNDFLLTFEQSLSDTTFWNPDHFFTTGENDSINFGGNST